MTEESPFSMFGRASKKPSKEPVKKPKLVAAQTPPPPPPPPAEKISDQEVAEMFRKMREMRDNIKGQLLDVYDKSGVPREAIERFVDINQKNNQELQDKLHDIENQVNKTLGRKSSAAAKATEQNKEKQKRQKKFIGKRQKWMEM